MMMKDRQPNFEQSSLAPGPTRAILRVFKDLQSETIYHSILLNCLPSNSGSDATAIREQPDTSTEWQGKKQRLASRTGSSRNYLARSYLDRRAPPDPEHVKDL